MKILTLLIFLMHSHISLGGSRPQLYSSASVSHPQTITDYGPMVEERKSSLMASEVFPESQEAAFIIMETGHVKLVLKRKDRVINFNSRPLSRAVAKITKDATLEGYFLVLPRLRKEEADSLEEAMLHYGAPYRLFVSCGTAVFTVLRRANISIPGAPKSVLSSYHLFRAIWKKQNLSESRPIYLAKATHLPPNAFLTKSKKANLQHLRKTLGGLAVIVCASFTSLQTPYLAVSNFNPYIWLGFSVMNFDRASSYGKQHE